MSMYIIKHVYDVDGGFGDAIGKEDVVGIVECTKEQIDKFIEKYDKPVVYDEPYMGLVCHILIAEEVTVTTLDEIEKDPYNDNGVFQSWIDSFKHRDPEGFNAANEELEEEE